MLTKQKQAEKTNMYSFIMAEAENDWYKDHIK